MQYVYVACALLEIPRARARGLIEGDLSASVRDAG
jgi:hypothetical protein